MVVVRWLYLLAASKGFTSPRWGVDHGLYTLLSELHVDVNIYRTSSPTIAEYTSFSEC